MSHRAAVTPDQFLTFGELLKYLRHRAGLSQLELSIAVGYSEGQISRLEHGLRAPDSSLLAARFVPALGLERDPEWAARLLELADRSQIKTSSETPSRTADTPPTNLPLQLTSFVGRENEIAAIKRLVIGDGSASQPVRLLTLTGPAGSGKTRLAIQAASQIARNFADGVFFINLAPVTETALVAPTIAQPLGVKPLPGQTFLDALKDYFGEKEILLLLDNFEQVSEAARELTALLSEAPDLKMIVTSRMVLRLTGEKEFLVAPLPVPDGTSSSPDVIGENEAVKLFMQRAQAVREDWKLTEANAQAIAAICVRVDGLPLAIELAAARIRVLTVEELLARLSKRLEVLTGGARDLPTRQQTLRSTIDWSYQLLDASEKRLFARLSVFAGGWTLEAAAQVCNAMADLGRDVVDGLQSLVEHNMIQQTTTSTETVRFTMLETLREYALEQLDASEERATLGELHAKYYVRLIEAARALPVGDERLGFWKNRIDPEHDNMRAALAWSHMTPGTAELGLRLTSSAWLGDPRNVQVGLERALARADQEEGVYRRARARALANLAEMLYLQGNYARAESCFAESLRLDRLAGDLSFIAQGLERWGFIARERGDTLTARARLEEALILTRELKISWIICLVGNTLGETLIMLGDTDSAERHLEESLQIARQIPATTYAGWSLNHLGHIAQIRGEFEKATKLHLESLSLLRGESLEYFGPVEALHCLGECALGQNDPVLAASRFEQGLELAEQVKYRAGAAWCLAGFAGVAVLQEEPDRAAILWGAAEHLRSSMGVRKPPAADATHTRLMEQARQALGDVVFDAAWERGQRMPLDQVIALALNRVQS